MKIIKLLERIAVALEQNNQLQILNREESNLQMKQCEEFLRQVLMQARQHQLTGTLN